MAVQLERGPSGLLRLRLPRLQRTIEFLCLVPLAIPAIVLVVGLAPVYAFRSIDAGLMALDLKTLSEAARSLGARWPTVNM